jgi:hypothetical protein
MKLFIALPLLLLTVFNCIAQDNTKVGINNTNPQYNLDITGSLRSSDSLLVGILRTGSPYGYMVTWDSVTQAFTKVPVSAFFGGQTFDQTLTNGNTTNQYVQFNSLNGATGDLLTSSLYGFRSSDTSMSGLYFPIVFKAGGSGLGDWSVTHNSAHISGQTGYNEPLWIGYNIDQAQDSGSEIHLALENNWRQPGHLDDDRWFEAHLEVFTSRDSVRYRPYSWVGGKRTAYGLWMFRSNSVDYQDPVTGASYLSGGSDPTTGAFSFAAQAINGTSGIRFQGTGHDNNLYIDAIPVGQTAFFRDFNSIVFGRDFVWSNQTSAESLKVPMIEQTMFIGRTVAWPVTFGMGEPGNAYFTMSTDGGIGEHSFEVKSGYRQTFKVNGIEKGRFSENGFILPASTTINAPFNIAHGVAPSNPVNGDIWTTQSGVFAQINGATIALGELGELEKPTSSPTAKLVTTNSTPVIVQTISIAPGENVIVEATVSAILSNGNGSYHSKKARGFLKNSAGILSEDSTMTDLMPDKYRGTGLSSPTFNIKSDGDEIIIEAIGEDNDNLTWNFSFTILRNQVTL